MNHQKVSIELQLDFATIQQIDIINNPFFKEWNKITKQNKIGNYQQVNIYRNEYFRLPYRIEAESLKNSKRFQRQDTTQVESKQYKKKKITKVDKFHIKSSKKKKQTKNQKHLEKSYQSTQSKRKKQLQAKHKKYKSSKNEDSQKITGKKQPKQAESSKQKQHNKIKKKIIQQPLKRKNFLMSSIDTSQIITQQHRTRSKYQHQDHQFQELQEELQSSQDSQFMQDESISHKQKSKKSKQKKKYKSQSKSKKISIPKLKQSSYLLQEQQKTKSLRQKFSNQVLSEVPGRKDQADRIFQLIINSENGSSTPICLHGNTGCGKTSLVTKMLNFVVKQFPKKFSTAYLNCMTMWSVNHVYSGILYKLFGYKQKRSQRALNNLFQCSQHLATKSRSNSQPKKDLTQQIEKTKIIVLDEIDHFIKDQTFIYNLLEWTHIKNSKIILIMISNILDLSVNLSAKIQSRMKFESLVFKPYSHEAIQEILKYKYHQASKIFQPKAMTFLCRKVASINSDIRLLEKIYEDVVTQWSEANGLVDVEEDYENDQDFSNMMKMDQESRNIYDQESSNIIKPKNIRKERKKYTDRTQALLNLSKTKKLTISDVQKSLFLTGELNNQQIPEIMKEYETILKVLHKAQKKQQVSYEIMNKSFMKQKKMPSSQEIFLLMCQLKDMGLVQFRQNTKNCDVTFQGFGIKINKELHLMCPQQ